ncbi:carboxypeptidase-like regulatory domain-containing protein, partial [Agriterribacter sp.]|uniref:carboxypeptidase-like regulatory domain-containing protein n=1 Tax=Agriterribacter sp. TaxID=2821509 RepID=UPI002C6BDFF1
MNKLFKIFSWSLLAVLSCFHAQGQNYPVKVQVQLVQPFYPYLSDYKQRSIISFTNTVDVPMDIYIQAKLENDRGQMIKTAPNQYSRTPIHLASLQTTVVQGYQLDTSFFDLHNLQTNLDDQTKARLYRLGMIPEGFYSYCVTAFRIDGNGNYQPVSDPKGSCAFVNIGYVQPPQILSPLADDNIIPNPVQNLNITWTRPVGNLQGAVLTYDLYLVRVLQGQDPALAMSNAVQYGAGIFMKQENIPATVYRFTSLTGFQLEEGDKYALMIQSRDMNGKAAFVNNGRSEVSVFTYGAEGLAGNNGTNGLNPDGNNEDMDVVTGKLQWAFKNAESGALYQYNSVKDLFNIPEAPAKPASVPRIEINAGTRVTKPSYKFNSSLLINMDPSAVYLTEEGSDQQNEKRHDGITGIFKENTTGVSAEKKIDVDQVIQLMEDFTATVADSTHSDNKTVQADTGSQRFSLTGVNVTLSGNPVTDPQKIVLLGTGVTDNEGRFTIQFLDPSYRNSGNFSRLILSVQVNKDFENSVFEVPVPGGNIPEQFDIGTKVLLARTWRFFPQITYETSDATDAKDCEVHVYREASEYQDRPWLKEEGRTDGKERQKEVIDGKEVFKIASLSIGQKVPQLGLKQVASHKNEGVGRLFYGGKLLVKIVSASASYYEVTSIVTAVNKSLPGYQVMEGEAVYQLKTRPSHIEGNISLFLREQSSVPVSGAAVRIMYREADVVEQPPRIFDNVKMVSATNMSQLGNYTVSQLTGRGLTKVNSEFTGVTPALGITTASGNGNSNKLSELTYTIKPVMAAEKDKPSPVCDGCSYKIAYTDATGNYYSDNLPVLREGGSFTVEVIKTPGEFSKFEIKNKSGGAYPSMIALGKGISKKLDFTLNTEVADVGGRIVDREGEPLPGVRLLFNGNTLTTSGTDGLFVFKLYPGNHLITLEKEGYVRKNVPVNIPVSGSGATPSGDKWANLSVADKNQATLNRIKAIPTVQSALSAGYQFSPVLFGLPEKNSSGGAHGTTVYNASIAVAFGINVAAYLNTQYEIPRESAMDMKDIGYLEKITGKIQFTIKDKETGQPVADAAVSVFDSTHISDANGQWYYEGFGGSTLVTVKPSPSSEYAPERKLLTLAENGKVQDVTILLEKGVTISGIVKSGNTALVHARVFADDGELSSTTTDDAGNYTLVLKKGEHDLFARMQNYVQDEQPGRSIPGDGTVFNFDLKGGNGKNYATLLGFDIELTNVVTSGSEEIWSGNFINLQPADPSVFVFSGKSEIPFSDQRVRFDAAGNAQPVNNKVETDITRIPLKIFNFLPAGFVNGNVVTVTGNGGNKG